MAKAFKPPLYAICAVSAAGLDVRLSPSGKEVTRKAFSVRDLRQAQPKGWKVATEPLIDWLRTRKIIQGPIQGPFALTDKGARVVNRACTALAKRVRSR